MKFSSTIEQKKELLVSSVWVFFITSLLHFAWKFTNLYALSFISAVNESIWEHTKIVFFAVLIYDLIIYVRRYLNNKNFIAGLTPSLASVIITVPLFYYSYTGILKVNLLPLDLLIVFLSAFISQYILLKFIKCHKDFSAYNVLSALTVLAMVFMFVMFTWYPPKLPLFEDL